MSMDLNGKAPTSEHGKSFSINVWGWRPLWGCCEHFAPVLCSKVRYAQSNDGDGLDAQGSVWLATVLTDALNSGKVAAYCAERNEQLATMADEPCSICAGTGYRTSPPQCGAGTMPCNGCHTTGKVRPHATFYITDAETVRDFANFLKDCGGFEIW